MQSVSDKIEVLIEADNWKGTRKEITVALRSEPESHWLLSRLALIGREREALKIYKRLIDRGAQSIAYGECGEGLARARGLVADSYFRMATCLEALGKKTAAMEAFERHLDLRGPGCQSIYPLNVLRQELKQWRKQRIHRNRVNL